MCYINTFTVNNITNHVAECVFLQLLGYSVDNLKSILKESIAMIKFDHSNVLSILGVSLDTHHEGGLPFIVLPFMVNGDLKTYLTNKRQSNADISHLPEVRLTKHE